MNIIEQVNVAVQSNVYFGGKVISRSIYLSDGSRQTLGVVLPGEYEFSTAEGEIMYVTSGEFEVLLPNASEWVSYKAGSQFELATNVTFSIRNSDITEYRCQYL